MRELPGGLLQYKYISPTPKTNDWLESGLSDHHLEREQQTNLNKHLTRVLQFTKCEKLAFRYVVMTISNILKILSSIVKTCHDIHFYSFANLLIVR